MNPSTEDVLQAIERVNAKNIFIFPNNKNIILAANQARDLTEDKNIIVIPTKTIPQGITALISYVPDKTVEQNTEEMMEAVGNVKTGQITYAVRDTKIDDKEIRQGDIMGIGDHGLLAVGTGIEDITVAALQEMTDEDSEIISVYYGQDVSEEDAEHLVKFITADSQFTTILFPWNKLLETPVRKRGCGTERCVSYRVCRSLFLYGKTKPDRTEREKAGGAE